MSIGAQTDETGRRSFLGATVSEMHRRRVFRVATAYAVVAFVLLQVAEITFEPLQLPLWSLTALILVVVLLFPIAMALAWTFDLTPQGIRRTEASEHSSRGRSIGLLLVVLALDGAAAYFLYRIYAPQVLDPPPAQALLSPGAPIANGLALEATAPPPAGSVAVLPFADLSPTGEYRYFADGIATEIIALLGRVEGVVVPARTSSFAFRDSEDLREVGATLHVGAVLEGTVRLTDESMRLTVQLVNVATGYAMWSQSYDRPVSDVLAVQDEIVANVAEQVAGEREFAVSSSDDSRPPASFEAFDRYLEGRDLWRQRTPESLARACEIFEQTIELDPGYAPAYSGLADSYLLLASYGNLAMGEAIRKSMPLIRAALELDGELSEGFASLGLIYWNLGRPRAAESNLRNAIKLDPDNIVAHVWLAGLISSEGRLGEQEAILRQGLDKDPLNLLLNINLASNELLRGRSEAGFRRLEETREIFPTSTLVLRTLAEWRLVHGRIAEAIDLVDSTLTLAPGEPPNHAMLADMLLRLGALEPARRALDKARDVGPENVAVHMIHANYLWRSGRHVELRQLAEGMLEGTGETLIAGKEAKMPEYWLGRIMLQAEDPDEATTHFGYVLADREKLPPMFAVDVLAWNALAREAMGDPEGASRDVDRAARHMEALHLEGMAVPEVSYLDAVIAALRDESDQALAHLWAAVDSGWIDAWQAENDRRLADLHGRAEFQSLMGQVRADNEAALADISDGVVALRSTAARNTVAAR